MLEICDHFTVYLGMLGVSGYIGYRGVYLSVLDEFGCVFGISVF